MAAALPLWPVSGLMAPSPALPSPILAAAIPLRRSALPAPIPLALELLADAVLTSSGAVTGISVDTPGAGYSQPVVSVSGGGATVDATATAYGHIDSLTLNQAGQGYTMPTVDFDMPADPNGRIAKAHVIWDPSTGDVTGIELDDPGSGYDRAPQVVIRDGTLYSPINTRALERAYAARDMALDAIDAGLEPLAVVNPAATVDAMASATLAIDSVAMDTYGSNYTAIPTVTIGDAVGFSIEATATASLILAPSLLSMLLPAVVVISQPAVLRNSRMGCRCCVIHPFLIAAIPITRLSTTWDNLCRSVFLTQLHFLSRTGSSWMRIITLSRLLTTVRK